MSSQPAVATLVLYREGCPLHVWTCGPPDARLVVLVHGAGMDHHLFDHQIQPLVHAGFRTAAVDLRGHGASQPIGTTPFTIGDLAGDLCAVADALGAPAFVVVGHSVGGFAAQELVLRHPHRVQALVAVGSACITAPLSRLERVGTRLTVRGFAAVPFTWISHLVARTTAVTEEAQRYAYASMMRAGRSSFLQIWSAISHAVHPIAGYSVPAPLLLVRGDRDTTGNVKASLEQWHRRDVGSQLVVLDEAGHNANQDNPHAFNRHFLNFLVQRVPRPR